MGGFDFEFQRRGELSEIEERSVYSFEEEYVDDGKDFQPVYGKHHRQFSSTSSSKYTEGSTARLMRTNTGQTDRFEEFKYEQDFENNMNTPNPRILYNDDPMGLRPGEIREHN